MPSTEVTTLCFHTQDAVERHGPSGFTFEMPRLPAPASKVALASFEFPMVQYTVEAGWNKLWFFEGVRLAEDHVLYLVAKLPNEPEPDAPVALVLPRLLNPVTRTSRRDGLLVCECAYAHGLVDADETAQVVGASRDARVAKVFTPTSVGVRGGGGAPTAIHMPPVPSPQALCARLTAAARGLLDEYGVKLAFAYDARTDRVLLRAVADVPGTFVRVLPGPLATSLGLSTAPVRVDGAATGFTTWHSEPTQLWDFVEVPCGFYAPCQRPMSVGQPMRLGTELENAVNRWYFPLVKEDAPHLLLYTDADGVQSCEIPPGRYTAATLCAYLTRKASSLTVTHDGERFTFASSDDKKRPFSLLFHHPRSVDPSRFGFAAQPLSGSSAYVAPERTKDGARGLLRFSEMTAQRRFRVHTTPPPPMHATPVDESSRSLAVTVNGAPFAHGCRPGDVVEVSGSLCVVHADDDDPCVLRLRDPPSFVPADGVAVVAPVDPLSLCFCKPGTLPPALVGFPKSAVQWGVDGSVGDAQGNLMPPFEAPYVFDLEHPDAVLLTFSETAGATLSHSYGGESRPVFVKLPMYPAMREERMLPRDSTLYNARPTRFTLSVFNPDGRTPYEFHGAEFSFSLAFVSAVP